MGEPSTQIYFTAYNSNEHSKVRTAGLLFCKPLSFAFAHLSGVRVDYAPGAVCLSVFDFVGGAGWEILCRNQASDVNQIFLQCLLLAWVMKFLDSANQ